MNNMLHLPPIPTSILGLSNIEIEDAAISNSKYDPETRNQALVKISFS